MIRDKPTNRIPSQVPLAFFFFLLEGVSNIPSRTYWLQPLEKKVLVSPSAYFESVSYMEERCGDL